MIPMGEVGYKLQNVAGSSADCPCCGKAMYINTNAPDNVLFSCSNGCKQSEILTALNFPPYEQIFLQTGEALPAPVPAPPPQMPKMRLRWDTLSIELMKRGWSVKRNLITQEIDISARTLTGRVMSWDDLLAALHTELAENFKGCSLDVLHSYLSYIASENAYNPVLERMESLSWDGRDRLPELFDLMHIKEDPLSQVLVTKWLLQTIALLFNSLEDAFGADGVLVLNGGQGVGKTSLFRRLALNGDWFGEGALIKDNDKDTLRRCVTRWITELGEVESTLKSDISALKAVVTASTDNYRLPYARADRKTPRITSMCATCNSDRYLIDPTGNRRWWSVPISEPMDYDAIQKFDAEQLWAQIYAIVAPLPQKERAACFRLSRTEQTQLAERNGSFEKPVKAEDECRDLIEAAKNQGMCWAYMTVAEWKSQNLDVLRPYSTQQIGEALKKIGCTQARKRLSAGGNPSRVYELPTQEQAPAELKLLK